MEFGTIVWIIGGITWFGIWFFLDYRIMELKDRYCSYCGQYMELVPFRTRIMRKLARSQRICTNIQCPGLQPFSFTKKLLDASKFVIGIWIPFYAIIFRMTLVQEAIEVGYGDITTGLFMGIILFGTWVMYKQKMAEHPIKLDVI